MKKAGYKIEPAFGSEDTTMVVEVPVDVGEGIRTAAELIDMGTIQFSCFFFKDIGQTIK